MVFSHMTSSEKRMKENGELDVLFVFILLVHVCWCIYNRYYGSMSLRQVKYKLCFALTAIYTIRSFLSIFLLKLLETGERLNNSNYVTEWDNWFVCVAVEACEKKKSDLFLVPDIFRCVLDIFLSYLFGASYFSTEIQLMRLLLLFFRHFIFGKVWLLLFNTILNILIGFQCTCKYMYQWVWA